jgi:uncharacterized protein (TIGR02145 family)
MATAKLGSPWKLPTSAQFQELFDNSDTEEDTINGTPGIKFMKKTDHNVFVFFPYNGYYVVTSLVSWHSQSVYWSATFSKITSYGLHEAWALIVDKGNTTLLSMNCYMGMPVRAVK